MPPIHYAPAVMAKQVSAVTATSSETTLFTITDSKFLQPSQISILIDCTLGASGGNTKLYLRYYVSFDNGATYYQIPVMNLATGEVINLPDMMDSNSPVKFVRDIPMSGGNSYKVTMQTDMGTATINYATAMVRDN